MSVQGSDHLQQLETIEQQIASSLQCAANVLSELAKDKPSLRQGESHATAYLKSLDSIEDGLSKHITYLTQCATGQPHEGSCYAAQNESAMARFRWEHVRSRLSELDKMKIDHLQQQGMQYGMVSQPARQLQGLLRPPSSQQGAAQAMDTTTGGATGQFVGDAQSS